MTPSDSSLVLSREGLDPTATSGVFKFTGVLMSIIDKASFTARQWAEHLATNAFIGQELYLTISHPQRDEGGVRRKENTIINVGNQLHLFCLNLLKNRFKHLLECYEFW